MVPLASIGELENHLQRPVDPDIAVQALQLASGAVRAYCQWDLTEATETLQVDGDGTVVCTLPTLKLTAITEVRIDGVAVDITPAAVSFSKKGQLYRAAGWPRFSIVEVDCTHGFDPVPDLIVLVTLDLAARTLNNPEGLVSATTGRVSKNYGVGEARLSALHERLLSRYSL